MQTLIPSDTSGIVLADGNARDVRAINAAFALAASDGSEGSKTKRVKYHGDKRVDRYKADVVKRKDKPLTDAQKTALIFDLRAGYKCAVKGGDERSFDDWRAAIIEDETREHRSGPITGLREALGSHFRALRARAYEEAGKHLEAYELRLSDTPEGERLSFLRWKVQELLNKLPPRVPSESAEATEAMRTAYGDTMCKRMFNCRVINADVGQLDKLYRELKPAVTAAANVRRALAKLDAEDVTIHEVANDEATPF